MMMIFVGNSDNPHQRTICAAEQQRDDGYCNNDKMLNSGNPYQKDECAATHDQPIKARTRRRERDERDGRT